MGKEAKKPSDEEENVVTKAKKPFDKRKFVSVFTGFSFVLMTLTGLALFFAPSCRIARDTSWAIWGHSKEQFVAVHVWFSIVFLIAAGYHTYLNWAAMKSYFKTKVGQSIGLRTEWVAALLICLVIYVGTVRTTWPFSSLIDWQETYKHGASGGQAEHGYRGGRGGGYGSSMGGHVEPQVGFGRGRSQNVEDIAAAQRGRGRQGGGQGQGANAPRRGMGQMTLSEFCQNEGIELTWAILRLRNEGFTAQGTMTIREIADGTGVHPSGLRDILGLEGDCDHE
jgi:hypothetical protein